MAQTPDRQEDAAPKQGQMATKGHSYVRFLAMILTSTVVMYAFMYLNTYQWDHVYFSWSRLYMSLLMGATMAVIMLSFMLRMYTHQAKNLAIYVGSVAVFILGLWLVRSQTFVGDVAWMKAMIPHHSIAILTSERARLKDPRVRDLAGRIISAQKSEITEMKGYIQDLQGR